jgi:hypothetical protein
MTTFNRKFPVNRLSDAVLGENAWLCDLLRYWRPPGDEIGNHSDRQHAPQTAGQSEEDPKRLRLAVRKGYLNFYRRGQSVAKVDVDDSEKLRARVHNKYVYGDGGEGHDYVFLTAAGVPERGTGQLTPYDRITCLDEWISNANGHSQKEKGFVDEVVARNPNVIDLEMGLPACPSVSNGRSAPRMDLVVLEPVKDTWQIVFWEAKLVADGRARCRGKIPKVCDQLGNYTKWLRYCNNKSLVQKAYQEACRILVDLHKIASRLNPDIRQLGAGIQAVATDGAALPGIDDKPRLLIDDRKHDISFTKKHLEKLRKADLHVQMVEGEDQMALRARS